MTPTVVCMRCILRARFDGPGHQLLYRHGAIRDGAATATKLGKTVALVDSHHELGGAGVNTGTVPSKTLRETALALSGLRSRDLYGVHLSLRREATVEDFLHHERAVKVGANAMLSQLLDASGSRVYAGSAAFLDPNTISVKIADQHGRGGSGVGSGSLVERNSRAHRDRLSADSSVTLSIRPGCL